MFNSRRKTGMSAGRELWPVLTVLVLAVVVPTVCVLWFMTQAVRNERLAVRQKITDIFETHLADLRRSIDEQWVDRTRHLAARPNEPPSETFFRLTTNHQPSQATDAVVIYDRDVRIAYPMPALALPDVETPPEWNLAESLEYEQTNPLQAAASYGRIADQATNIHLAARARQGQVRCLAKAGQTARAIDVVETDLRDPKYWDAIDPAGRRIVPDLQLFAFQLMMQGSSPRFTFTPDALIRKLADYHAQLPSPQRLFLMTQILQHWYRPSAYAGVFPTWTAERLADDFLRQGRPRSPSGVLVPAGNGLWRLTSADSTIVGLFTQERVLSELQSLVRSRPSLVGAMIEVRPTAVAATGGHKPFLTVSAGEHMPDWQIRLSLTSDPFSSWVQRQTAAYLWIAILVIVAIVILAVFLARYLIRQMAITRLKNDFIATVSHEFKTPLASMRVLTDTLLEGRYCDELQAREYLELIGRENERLSRLIENFLTFSRMERNRRTFDFVPVAPEQIAVAAVGAVREKFHAGGCALTTEIAPDLPAVTADHDAMVTVLLNLLDNAFKYSENDKRVRLRVCREGDGVCFQVADKGIGLSRSAIKKIFDRFYQVDQTLSRKTGGCGLGLSIVKFIVDAHGGAIDVKSQPGQGTTFTVRLPVNA